MLTHNTSINYLGEPTLSSEVDTRDIDSGHREASLSLLQQYGANAWKVHNYLLEADTKAYEEELERLKNRVTEVNRDRKNSQVCYLRLPLLLFSRRMPNYH